MRIKDIVVSGIYTNSKGLHRQVVYEGTFTGFKDPLRVQYKYLDGPSVWKRGSCSKKKFAQWAVRREIAIEIADIVKYYWNIPFNLRSMANQFEQSTDRNDLEFVLFVLHNAAKHIERSLRLLPPPRRPKGCKRR